MKGGLSCVAFAFGLLTETLFALGQTNNPTAVAQGPSSPPPSGVLMTPPPAPVLVPPSGVLPTLERHAVTGRPLKMAQQIHIAKSSAPVSMRRHTISSPPAAPLPAATEAERAAGTQSPSQGYAVQIAALNVRSEADAMARRLASKGYAAYVLTPANGTPAVYRVRIGTFKTRREAEAMAARLQKEEQFKPWITK